MKIDFDKKFGTLYIVFTDNSNSYGDVLGNIILMRDIDTNKITGITILSFLRKFSKRKGKI